jgi:RNA polymerase sigma-70 factor (ECF subfamily)
MNKNDERNNRLRLLMQAAQDGNATAYAALLEEIAPIVRRMVRRKWGFLQQADVEDIVQDVLLSVHSARATYDPTRPFGPWLMAICHNRIVDSARRYKRRTTNEVLVDEMPEAFSEDPANMIDERFANADALRGAILQLPSAQQKAVNLLKLQEMSLKEAAAASGMTVSSLKVAVHRGVKALRGKLKA